MKCAATGVHTAKMVQWWIDVAIGTLALLTIAAPAWAEWDSVYVTDTAVHYIDLGTIQKDSYLRRVWTLQDLKARGSRGERSMKGLMEYDCKQERVRVLRATAYSGQMARGDILITVSTPAKWNHIAPESAFNTTLRFLCAK